VIAAQQLKLSIQETPYPFSSVVFVSGTRKVEEQTTCGGALSQAGRAVMVMPGLRPRSASLLPQMLLYHLLAAIVALTALI
jgi:hypothetical protein